MNETARRLAKALRDRYALERELGHGGMATVWLARDLKHDRPVALKVLRPEIAAALGPERFLREIRLTAQFNHPHILPLLDSGNAAGLLYYVMPYVDGESLRDRLVREQQLPLGDALGIAHEVADALSYAHAHDVVHRDIKPENILLESGHAVVADFGVARAITAATGAPLAETEIPTGSPAYMSPEQATGTQDVDGRSDVYSLGCVLYEMLAGRPPFAADASQGVPASHALDPISWLSTIRRVPRQVEKALARALKKAPVDRYASAQDFVAALERVADSGRPVPERLAAPFTQYGRRVRAGAAVLVILGGIGGYWTLRGDSPGPVPIRRLAVLPFQNMTGDPEQEYFVAGLHEALIDELGQIAELEVISRTSVMPYQATSKSVPQIARDLGVQGVVEASVFKAGDSVHIEVRLLRAVPEEHELWARTYDGESRHILALQKEVTREIAKGIRVKLAPREAARLATAREVDPRAYDAWARGQYQASRLTEGSLRRCIDYATEALTIDSTYAPGWALAARCYNLLPHLAPVAPQDAYPKARIAATRALQLDEGLSEAHFDLGWTLAVYDWNWRAAEQEIRRSAELGPGRECALGWFLSWLGRVEEALAECEKGVTANPVSPSPLQSEAAILYIGRRYDQAIAVARRAVEMDSGNSFSYDRLALAYVGKGMYADAIATLETAVRLTGHSLTHQYMLATAYALAGRHAQARGILEEWRQLGKRSYVPPTSMAIMSVVLGETDEAVRWLEEGYRVRDGNMVLLRTFGLYDPLRSDPRFQRLLNRMHFPESTGRPATEHSD